jgi:hypothetical protein
MSPCLAVAEGEGGWHVHCELAFHANASWTGTRRSSLRAQSGTDVDPPTAALGRSRTSLQVLAITASSS